MGVGSGLVFVFVRVGSGLVFVCVRVGSGLGPGGWTGLDRAGARLDRGGPGRAGRRHASQMLGRQLIIGSRSNLLLGGVVAQSPFVKRGLGMDFWGCLYRCGGGCPDLVCEVRVPPPIIM